MTQQALLEQAKELPRAEQMELALELIDLGDGNDQENNWPWTISPEVAAELDRRIQEDDADQSPGEEWSVVREKLLRGDF